MLRKRNDITIKANVGDKEYSYSIDSSNKTWKELLWDYVYFLNGLGYCINLSEMESNIGLPDEK